MTSATELLRQVHPSWVQNGRVTSQAFRPTPKDQRLLSTYDGDAISAIESWQHYTQSLQFASAGVMAVLVQECTQQKLAVRPDPAPFDEHVVVDFNGLSTRDVKVASKVLKRHADERGWLHIPPD